jgi:hypothetical protein
MSWTTSGNQIALEQLRRRKAGEHMTGRVARLPHVSKQSKRRLGPLQTSFVDP